jgi:hypothetical protein
MVLFGTCKILCSLSHNTSLVANKFLDDNTFTNKTWSDVSGMKVTDLNIMELEFLDVLRFKLFIRSDEYERWKKVLLQFKSQLQNANQAQKQEQQQQLFEEAFKGIVLPTVQHQQQYQNNYLLMLSQAQQPQYQPPSRPLTRVPLRIPHQPVWRNAQTVPVSSSQAPMYDANMIHQAPPSSTIPYLGTSSTASQQQNMSVMVPTQAPPSSDYYSKQPVYDNYAQQQGGGGGGGGGVNGGSNGGVLSNDHPQYYQPGYSQATTPTSFRQSYSQQSLVNNASSRLSGMNLSAQTPDYNSSTPNSSNFYLTPPTKPATTPDYYRQQRNSYYDMTTPKDTEYYDDAYAQPTSGYQQVIVVRVNVGGKRINSLYFIFSSLDHNILIRKRSTAVLLLKIL